MWQGYAESSGKKIVNGKVGIMWTEVAVPCCESLTLICQKRLTVTTKILSEQFTFRPGIEVVATGYYPQLQIIQPRFSICVWTFIDYVRYFFIFSYRYDACETVLWLEKCLPRDLCVFARFFLRCTRKSGLWNAVKLSYLVSVYTVM
jgi:hypothetical protein